MILFWVKMFQFCKLFCIFRLGYNINSFKKLLRMGEGKEEQLLIRGGFFPPPEYYEFFFRGLKCYNNKEQEALSLLMCTNDERKSRKTT